MQYNMLITIENRRVIMKFHSKLLALLMALLLAVSTLGSFTVFATEDEYAYTVEDVEYLASLLGISYDETLDYLGITEDDLVVSAGDASASDVAVTYTDMLSGIDFETLTTAAYNISYKVPKSANVYNVDSDELDIYGYLEVSKEDLMNSYNVIEIAEYSDSLSQAVVYYQISVQESTPYGKHIGNYNKLTSDEQDALIQLKVEEGYSESNTYFTRKSGQLYLVARSDNDYMADNGLCTTEADVTTIIDGTVYNAYIYIQHGGTASDAKIVDNIVDTFRVKGAASADSVNKTLAIVALCICGVLLIVVGFLVFFIIRFSMFSSASGSKFNIIGFNMPAKVTSGAVSKHQFHAKENISDSLDDEE